MTPKKSAPSKAVAKTALRVPSTRVDASPGKALALRAEQPMTTTYGTGSGTITVTVTHPIPHFTGTVTVLGTVVLPFTDGTATVTVPGYALGAIGAAGFEVTIGTQSPAPPYDANLDTLVSPIVSNAASATRAALGAAYVPHRWIVPAPGVRITDQSYRQIPVIMMHNFTSSGDALGRIKNMLAWGYTPIFYSQMHDWLMTGDASSLPAKPIVITDDDGGASVYSSLYPNLTALGVKVTLWLVPDWIDGLEAAPPNGGSFMEASPVTWANVVEMFGSGLVELHSHTLTHGSMRLLSGARTFSATEDGTGAGADYLAAKARIEAQVPGSHVRFNAAPYGVINEAAIASLKAAGCEGNRITECGTDLAGDYDGSGPTGYVYPWTDPFRVPIGDDGSFLFLKRDNVHGMADLDGNMVQNAKFTQTQRGWTLPAGWTQPTVTLPSGANPATGTVLQGAGTAAATGAYHTDAIPVGFHGNYFVDWWVLTTNAPAASCRLALDCFVNPGDTTPVKTIFENSPSGGTTSWTAKSYRGAGDATYAWIRPRFEIVGATSGSVMQVWNVRVRRSRSALARV